MHYKSKSKIDIENVHEASLSLKTTPINSSSSFSFSINTSLESSIDPLSDIIILFFLDKDWIFVSKSSLSAIEWSIGIVNE